ncbi:MAG: DUF2800 domain-containing protein [Acidithiobacillus sp.]|nr:DUF2800 domain-containing protein [Acidithiobacillus sp.]
MAEHATRHLQPSGFKRTIHCPGWGQLCKDVPREESSKWAAEGSVAHCLGERCIKEKLAPRSFLGHTGWYNKGQSWIDPPNDCSRKCTGVHFRFPINEDMVDAVEVYVDRINEIRAALGPNSESYVERKFDLSWIAPGMFGTVDHGAVDRALRCAWIDDYKHGAGVPVDIGVKAGDNPQLSIYALGALGEKNPERIKQITATIVQPRTRYAGGAIKSITYEADDLYRWAKNVAVPAARAASAKNAPLCAGEWCHWCPGATHILPNGNTLCPEIRKQAAGRVEQMFPAEIEGPLVSVPDPTLLPGEKLDRILEFVDIFEAYIDAVRKEAFRRLRVGSADAPTKFKLVQGRQGNRDWKEGIVDGGDLELYLAADELYEKKFRSPSKVESALKKGGLKPAEIRLIVDPLLAERKEGAPTLAKIDDPRPALPPSAEVMFPE